MLGQGIIGFFLGKAIVEKIKNKNAENNVTATNATPQNAKTQEAEENELVEVKAEDGNWMDTANNYKDQMGRITEKSFKNNDGFWGFMNKMDHMGGTVMSQGFDPDKMEECQKAIYQTKVLMPKAVDYAERVVALESAIDILKDTDATPTEKNKLLKAIVERIEFIGPPSHGPGKKGKQQVSEPFSLKVFLRV